MGISRHIRQDPLDISSQDKILTMAHISVETKAEVTMIKFLSSVNQILLFHCFLVMLLAEMVRTEYEEDNAFHEDDDESFLTECAYAVSSLLPCLAALTLGAVVASG